MSPEVVLSMVAAVVGFALKTTFAFAVFWILSFLVTSPGGKFLIWLGFLTGTTAYWIWLVQGFLFNVWTVPRPLAGRILEVPLHASTWQLPLSWVHPLTKGMCGIGIAYLLTLGYFLLKYLKKQLHLRWVLRFAYEPPANFSKVFQGVTEDRFGRARLLILPGIVSPATFGWIHPTILLPASCLDQTGFEIEAILHHELHHIRRLDFVSNAVAACCRALLFFHPAAWYAMRKMQLQRELACDMAVVSNSPERRATYAECLVHFARLNLSANHRPWDLDFAASTHLKIRIHSVLTGSRRLPVWMIAMRTALGMILCATFVGIAPCLAVALSYASRQLPQRSTLVLSTPRSAKIAKTHVLARKDSISRTGSSTTSDVAPPAGQPEAVRLVPPATDASMRALANTTVSELGEPSEYSNNTLTSQSSENRSGSASRLPQGLPRSSATKMPTAVSVLTGAATEMARIAIRGDHDKDDR